MFKVKVQCEPALRYIDIVFGVQNTRITLFFYVLPNDLGLRDERFTKQVKETKEATSVDVQVGKRVIIGYERITTKTTKKVGGL